MLLGAHFLFAHLPGVFSQALVFHFLHFQIVLQEVVSDVFHFEAVAQPESVQLFLWWLHF